MSFEKIYSVLQCHEVCLRGTFFEKSCCYFDDYQWMYVISCTGILASTLGVFMITYAIFDLINGIIFIVDVNKYM